MLTFSPFGIGAIVTRNLNPLWVTPDDFKTILDACVFELGINYIDTAAGYIDAEEEIGIWLKNQSDETRTRLLIGTKVKPLWQDKTLVQPLTADFVETSLETSLKKLGVVQVKIFWMHAPDDTKAWKDTFLGFHRCVERGLTKSIGISNVSMTDIEEISDICAQNGFTKPAAVQNEFNLLAATKQAAIAERAMELGMRFFAYSPLAGGILSGKYRAETTLPEQSRWGAWSKTRGLPDYWNERMFGALKLLEQEAVALRVSPAALALAWCRDNPLVSTTLLGPRVPSHLQAVREASKLKPDKDLSKRLGTAFS